MARSTHRTTRYRKDEGTAQRDVVDQPTPFVGLLLAPFVVLLLTWIAHYAIRGWEIGGWEVSGNTGYLGLAVSLATVGAGVVAYVCWHFSYDRQAVWRVALTASAGFVGAWMPVLVWNGPNRYLATFFVLSAYIVSTVWAMPRLHVLRRDPRENEGGNEDDLLKQLGLDGYRSKGEPEVKYDRSGDAERITVDIQHRLGGVRRRLQEALPNIESLVSGPEGMSRVTAPPDGSASHSLVTIMLKDPLKGRVPWDGPSHPGGKPTDYSVVGMYDDGEPVWVWICGGVSPTTGEKMAPSGYIFMGMSRAGKTVTENRLLLETAITRNGAVILYFNKAKGAQDVQPIIAGVEVAVITDSRTDYQKGFDKVKDMIRWRSDELGRYGISAWSYDKCYANPPQVTLNGEARPMEPMSALIVHVGEADAILADDPEGAVFVASKGLSVGIIAGWSLQRAAATSMPTDLRYNIGTIFCFGTGDDYSAGFALSEPTIKAGAHPENWKARHPGKFYFEGLGVEEHRFPVVAKGISDESDEALYTNMRLLAEQYAPQMSKLDRGTAGATRGWWDLKVRETNELRRSLTPRTATPTPDAPTRAAPPAANMTSGDRMATPTDEYDPDRPPPFTADDPAEEEDLRHARLRQEVDEDIANTTHVGDRAIRGEMVTPDEDDETGMQLFAEMSQVNPNDDIPAPAADDVVLDDGKPEAPSEADAQVEFDRSLRQALTMPEFRDPDDPTGRSVVVRIFQLRNLNKFRSRPWFSDMLATMSDGRRVCPPGIRIEKLPDRTGEGWYRITAEGDLPSQNGHAR